VVMTRIGEYDGHVAIGVLRTTRRLAEASLVLPDDVTEQRPEFARRDQLDPLGPAS
jgi:hypothetical protein